MPLESSARQKQRYIAAFLLTVLALSSFTIAQSSTGVPAFSTFTGGALDSINLANLNNHVGIPLFGKPGRGMPFAYALSFDSSIWSPLRDVNGTAHWEPASNFGWRGLTEAFAGYVTYTARQSTCVVPAGQPTIWYNGFTYHDPAGGSHFGGNSVDSAGCLVVGFHDKETVNDGSGYIIDVTLSGSTLLVKVYTSSGSTIVAPLLAENDPNILVYPVPVGNATITDSNGNQLSALVSGSVVAFTDTLGSTVLTIDSSNQNAVKYTYTGPDGNPASIVVNYSSYTVATNFQITGIVEYPPTPTLLVSSIVFPDSSAYSFTYETTPNQASNVTGRLASIQVPNGGVISYAYVGGINGIFADGSTPGIIRSMGSNQWIYMREIASNAPSITTVTDPFTITDPLGNDTEYRFAGIHEIKRVTYQGRVASGNILSTQVTCYNGTASNCDSVATVPNPITEVDVYDQLPGGLESLTSTKYDSSGNPTETRQFDYGNGSPGPLLRKVVTAYAPLGNNIVGKPASVTVYDGAGNMVSQAQFGYDEATPTPTSAPQHIGINGSRGNVTSIKQSTAPNAYLTKSFTYYDTGTLNTYTDVNGAVITYNYGAGSCNSSYPASVTLPLNLALSTAWDCTGGVITSSTDENEQPTTYSYNTVDDPSIWRIKQQTDALGNVRSKTYGISTNEDVLTFNGGNSAADVLSTVDSYGRPITAQIRRAPGSGSFDTVEMDYDASGRRARATSSYIGAAGQTNSSIAAATISYDALSRVTNRTESSGSYVNYTYLGNDILASQGPAPTGENLKQKQFEYDALGRLTSVCELTTMPGSGSCAQHTPATGFLTRYTYDTLNNILTVTQNAQSSSPQVRSFTYDLVSRRTSVTSPESGTVNFFYDSDPNGACSTNNPGDLVRRIDAAGISTCYVYDARRRMISSSSSGIGVVNISGAERSTQVPSLPTGSLTITGSERSVTIGGGRYCAQYSINGRCVDWETDPPSTVYDWGTVTLTVNGHADSVTYGSGDTAATVTANLANWINGDTNAGVTATVSNGVLSLTGKQIGPTYSWSIASASSDPTDFGAAGSFSSSPTSGQLSPTTSPVYDTGIVSITVGTSTASVTYSQNDTPLSIANSLASAINASSIFPATASVLYPVRIELVAKQAGSYGLSAASASNNSNFTGASFSAESSSTSGIDASRQTKFVYDAATVNGQSMANAKGRLAEAITCTGNCTGSNIITDLGFSYDPMGNLTDTYESTPHSGGYYHLNASYWPNDRFHTLSGLPGLPTFTFGLDAEGRTSTIGASFGQNPVTATSFDPGGHVTSVTFGSGDRDTYNIDPNTGRMTQFQAFVGSNNLTGTINWNTNDTIAGLQIADPFNPASNQTCSYSYDDLARIASVNCGSAWAQTFSYDPFGNISKSGSGSFLPIYSAASNRIQSLPGFAPTYNANGALLNDGIHTYTWDSEGNLSSVDTVGVTYDAMGRMVEQARGSSYTQIVYSPSGDKLALMSGQSLQKAFLELPGGGAAVYTASGLTYYRHPDWLGSSRLASTPTQTVYGDISLAPFGESYGGSGITDLSYTHQQQDTAAGLYDFLYREYSPGQGRWISCDPAGSWVGNPADPQSWNQYAFTLNNPVNLVDPNGFEDKPPCKDLIQMGITNTSTLDKKDKNAEMKQVEELAAKYGYNIEFPYSQMGKISSVWDIFKQGQGATTAATKSSMEALQYTTAQGGTSVINISGGAQAYASAMANMPGASSQIQSIVYLSPGEGGSQLVRGTQSTDRYSAHGVVWDGIVNATATAEAGTVTDKGKLNCSKHSALCELKDFLDNKCKDGCMHDPCQSKIFSRNVHGPRDNPASGPKPPPSPPGIITICPVSDDGVGSCYFWLNPAFFWPVGVRDNPGGSNFGIFHEPFY
jgi:RHS repeat-associated protein